MPLARASSNTPLSSTVLTVHIVDLVAEYTVQHRFGNEGPESIEAVFSFPVPLDAAFVGMRATLAKETLEATIQPKRQASRAYDDAIADGHSAVLLSCPEPGVLCTNLGNLKPGEKGKVEIRFVCALGVADSMARFSLPLVHRPRYGTWNLADLETPIHDFAVEHPMEVSIRVEGLLAGAPVTCSTHAARFMRQGDALELSIGRAMLDRDFVLTFELSGRLPPAARLIADGDASLGMASFVLPDAEYQGTRNLDLCLVLDGSGSMSGDAIEQCRAAASSVIDALGDHDRIQVLRFGTSVVPLMARPMPASARVKQALRALVPTIDADLGGTEMGQALLQALAQFGPVEEARSRAVILVTDGAVQPGDLAEAKAAAIATGVRIFVVAVGSNAGTEVLRPLSERTGAILERAVPAESIDAGTMRQLRRARAVGPVEIQVRWPRGCTKKLPLRSHYPGDAVHVAAVLDAAARGSVRVLVPSLGMDIELPLGHRTSAPSIRSLLGQQRYLAARRKRREAIALHYGLLTQETSAVLVSIRADRGAADGLPQIVQVPQMVPEGMLVRNAFASHSKAAASAPLRDLSLDHCYLDIPGYLAVPLFQTKSATPDPANLAEPVEPLFALAVFRAILARLLALTASASDRFPTAREIIGGLDRIYREAATQLLESCGIALDDEPRCARLGLALLSVMGDSNSKPKQQVLLAVATRRGQAATGDPDAVDADVQAIGERIRDVLPSATKPKPRPTGATTMTDRTHITVLLDRTGSMQDIRADVVGGFNAFVDTHKAAPGEATLTLVQFDSQDPYELLYAAVPIQEAPPLTLAQYLPRASTPLYDAMGRAIAALAAKLEATPASWRPKKIIFVIVTDGQENASVEFRRDQVMALMETKKKEGWDFVFLSADLGALEDAQAMGVEASASLHFGKSGKGSRHAWASVAEKSVLRRAGAASVAFDAADREAQDDAK